jgi:hypothetical protein
MSVRFIGKCKGCKGCVRIEAPETRRIKASLGYGRTETRVFRRIPTGQEIQGYDRFFLPCLCGKHVEFKMIRGHVTEHKCNAKCLASTSGICECSCGGANHGASYST